MKNILIINQYSSTPKNGFGGRSYFLAESLSKRNNVALIYSSFHHQLFKKKHQASRNYSSKNIFNVISLKTLKYQSSRSIKRVINWFIFTYKIGTLDKRKIGFHPTHIILSSPPIIAFLGAYILSKRMNAKIFFEVRDIWPLSLVQLGGISKFNPLIIFMQLVEDFSYRTADGIISNLSNLPDHINQRLKKNYKFLFSPNGIVIKKDTSTNLPKNNQLNKTLKKINKFVGERKIIGYCGGLATANGMNFFLDIASKNKNPNLAWVIVGDGEVKKELISRAHKEKILNLKFFDAVPKELVEQVIDRFDILFLANEFHSIYKYGLSPMKLPEYLVSGKPVMHVTNSQSLLEKIGVWKVLKNLNVHEANAMIEDILNEKEPYVKINSGKAKKWINENMSYERIAKRIEKFLY